MKKFFIKLTYLLFIPAALIIYYSSFRIPKDEILDPSLKRKIESLVVDKNNVNIIIAGDSRADRQLIPKTIKEQTGFNTINIANGSCDLLTAVAAIKQNYGLNSKNIFVISASSWQVNDGAIDPLYMSLNCFNEMTLLERLRLYKVNLYELVRMQNELIATHIKLEHEQNRIDTGYIKESGFFGVNGVLKTTVEIHSLEKDHPWYKNINNDGIRWSLFKNSLHEIGDKNSFFIIYQPPVSHFWKSNISKSFIDIAEQEYSEKVKAEVSKYKNIIFLDFYNNDISELNDSMYYDIQHMNRKGAEVFSTFLSKKIVASYHEYLNRNDSMTKRYN